MKTASMRASTLRVFLTALSLAVGLVLLAALATAYAGDTAAPDSPPDPNRVDVVVDLGNGNVLTRRVTFTEPTLNGLQVLQRSGLNLESCYLQLRRGRLLDRGRRLSRHQLFLQPRQILGVSVLGRRLARLSHRSKRLDGRQRRHRGLGLGRVWRHAAGNHPGNPGRRRRAAVDASAAAAQRKLRQRRRDPGCDPGRRGRQPQSGPVAKHHR